MQRRKAGDTFLKAVDSAGVARVSTVQQQRIARPLLRIRSDHIVAQRDPAFITEPPMKDQGRHGDFERVMLPHLDAAHNLARWLVRDPSLAEDVVQDAYERACKYFATFRGGSGRAWLLQIVRNAAYSTLNARRPGKEVSLSGGMHSADEEGVDMDLPDSSPDPATTLAQRQELAALDDALNALPVAWRAGR